MHGNDTTAIRPGKLIHLIYRQPFTGAVPGDTSGKPPPPDEISERVVRVREVLPDGLGFMADCLRRCYEGEKPAGEFLFERVLWAREWDGKAIRTMRGFVIVPQYSRIIEMIREANPGLADRLAAAAARAGLAVTA